MATDPSTRNPHGYFARACKAFEHALELAVENSSSNKYLDIGGYSIHLRIAGAGMAAAITPALAHLEVDRPAAVDLTVCLWDSASTETEPLEPPRPADSRRLGRRGEIAAFNDDRFRTVYRVDASVFSMLDLEKNLAVFWAPDAEKLPTYIRGAPLNFILNWWMGERRLKLVHAGAVGLAHGGVLLAGAGGCGKSSTALGCLDSELFYAADDYCLVRVSDEPHVYSLYSSAKLHPPDVEYYPALKPAISNSHELEDDKALLMLHRFLPHKLSRGFPLRAILLPRLTDRTETRIEPMSPAAALMAWMPSNTEQLPGEFGAAFDLMSGLVQIAPTMSLELGSDRAQIPGVISRFLVGAKLVSTRD